MVAVCGWPESIAGKTFRSSNLDGKTGTEQCFAELKEVAEVVEYQLFLENGEMCDFAYGAEGDCLEREKDLEQVGERTLEFVFLGQIVGAEVQFGVEKVVARLLFDFD